MKIGVDLDDVLADFLGSFINYYNLRFRTTYTKEDFTDFNISKVLNMGQESTKKLINDFWYRSGLSSKIKPMEGAIENLNKLKELGELNIITSRQQNLKNKTINWVDKYFEGIFKEIYFSNHTSFEWYKGLTKSNICEKTKTKFFIEDCPDYAIDCAGKRINVLLLDKPYNKHVEIKNITRVYSWDDITNYFKNIQ